MFLLSQHYLKGSRHSNMLIREGEWYFNSIHRREALFLFGKFFLSFSNWRNIHNDCSWSKEILGAEFQQTRNCSQSEGIYSKHQWATLLYFTFLNSKIYTLQSYFMFKHTVNYSSSWELYLKPEPEPRYAQDMPKIGQTYAHAMPKIWPRYAQDISDICPRHAHNIAKICQRYAKYVPKICQRFNNIRRHYLTKSQKRHPLTQSPTWIQEIVAHLKTSLFTNVHFRVYP